jgi:hypothetical protein
MPSATFKPFMLSVVLLSVVILSVVMLSFVMLIVVMLNVSGCRGLEPYQQQGDKMKTNKHSRFKIEIQSEKIGRKTRKEKKRKEKKRKEKKRKEKKMLFQVLNNLWHNSQYSETQHKNKNATLSKECNSQHRN